jgi:SAM-dependent methyltransferase
MWSRLISSVKRNGFRGAIQSGAAMLEDAWFDRAYGVETSCAVDLEGLNISSKNKQLGSPYDPTRVRGFRKLMQRLDISEDCVFVDVGCGKGRILIAAASLGFRRIVGLEFAPELCELCRRNLSAFKRRTGSRAEFTVAESDAAEYKFPPDQAVFFFFNPFRRLVMEKVLQNIQHSIQLNPRPIWVILNRAGELEPAVENHANLKEIATYAYGNSRFRVYSNRRPQRRFGASRSERPSGSREADTAPSLSS